MLPVMLFRDIELYFMFGRLRFRSWPTGHPAGRLLCFMSVPRGGSGTVRTDRPICHWMWDCVHRQAHCVIGCGTVCTDRPIVSLDAV